MNLVDANLLIYACVEDAALHDPARAWLESRFNGDEPVGLALATLVAFVRLTTHARVFARPLDAGAAVEIVDGWLALPSVRLLLPTERHWEIFSRLIREARVRGALASDAHVAATAIEHGATLCTHDRDFMRFPGLRVEFPLESEA